MYQLLLCFNSSKKQTDKKTVSVCVLVGVRVCVWVCVCVCACVLDGEGSFVFASTALVVVWTAM